MKNYLIRQLSNFFYDIIYWVIFMKVKIIDESHEKDLEASVNSFLSSMEGEVIDIKFQTAVAMFGEEQVYCFTAMIIYN